MYLLRLPQLSENQENRQFCSIHVFLLMKARFFKHHPRIDILICTVQFF